MAVLPSGRISEKMISRVFAESQLREAGFVMAAHHCHPYYELFYVENGGCRFLIGDNMYDLHTGDFMLIPPNLLHYTRYLFGPCKRDAVFFRLEDISQSVREQLPQGDGFFDEMQIFQVPEAHRRQINSLIWQMLTEEKIGDAHTAPILQTMLQLLFMQCARVCSFFRDVPANIHTTDRQIVAAARFISEHYAEPVTASDIASAAGFSLNYLSRKFHEAAGIGLHQYLVFIRLQHAALELISTDDPVTEIAFRCGFTDSNYFKDAFKKAYGLPPREFRKKQQ